MLNISEIVDRAAEKWPSKVFLIDGERRTTYEEFRSEVCRWASFLKSRGVGRSDIVAVFSKNNVEMLYLWMASNRLGAVFSPYNFNLKQAEMDRLIGDSGPKLLFTDSDVGVGDVGGQKPEVIKFGDVAVNESVETVAETEPDDMSTLLYTSGTEDLPKGVMNTHLNWFSTLMSGIADIDMRHEDVFLLSIPIYHVAGLYTFLGFMNVGATIVLERVPNPTEIDALVRKHNVNYLIFPPTLFIVLSQLSKEPFPSVKKCISFGSFISANQFDSISRFFPVAEWRNYYGLTEATPLGTTLQPGDFPARKESIGKPHMNMSLKLLKPDGSAAAPGEVGEIFLRSPSVAKGYYNRPEKTRETFANGWLLTGDLARMDEGGFLYFVDRKKDIVRTGGENVSSVEVEREILKDERVAEVAVVGIPHPHWEEAVTAFVVLKKGRTMEGEELIQSLGKTMAGYKIPKKVVVMESLPHNASGKILKKELRQANSRLYLES